MTDTAHAGDDSTPGAEPTPHPQPHWLVRSLFLLVSLAVLAGAMVLAVHWFSNRPRASRGRPPERIPLVETVPLERGTHEVTISAMGTVIPADRVQVTAQVRGMVTAVNPDLVPGGLLRKGDRVVTIEQEDFELAVQEAEARLAGTRFAAEQKKLLISKARSALAQAEVSLRLEKGQRDVALREFEMLGEDVPEEDRDLVLRKPQLRAAQASYQAAEASLREAEIAHEASQQSVKTAETALRSAQLALERATVPAPFNGVVQDKVVSVGTYLAPGTPVATLVNADVYWVRLNLPLHQLKWVTTAQEDPDNATTVEFTHPSWDGGASRTGRVLKLAPDLEEGGRMAQLIVEVDDPRALEAEGDDRPPLMLGTLLTGTLHGAQVEDCVRIPRAALHDGNTVWIKTAEDTLDIRPLRIRARMEDAVLACNGLQSGDRLIVSDLGTPVHGMKLQEAGKGKGAAANDE